MRKTGFTLAEVIVTLGIIGVLAAITAPMVSNMTPDRDKVKVLKVHKILTDINREMLTDPGLYLPNGRCRGLGCSEIPSRPPFNANRFSGTSKYLNLLLEKLDAEPIGNITWRGTFETVDGIRWVFDEFRQNNRFNALTIGPVMWYEYGFYIDLDENGDDCTYSAQCTNPDRFRFNVDTNGVVTGGDPLTRAYLANPHRLNDRRNDIRTASGG